MAFKPREKEKEPTQEELNRPAPKPLLRAVRPDYVYHSLTLERFINRAMKDGKKSKTRRLVYGALETLQKKMSQHHNAGLNVLDVFHEAVANVQPSLEVRSKRVGGASYSVPVPVAAKRAQSLAIRALVNAFRKRSEKRMEDRLANEWWDAYERRGAAFQWQETQRKQAIANRVFLGLA